MVILPVVGECSTFSEGRSQPYRAERHDAAVTAMVWRPVEGLRQALTTDIARLKTACVHADAAIPGEDRPIA